MQLHWPFRVPLFILIAVVIHRHLQHHHHKCLDRDGRCGALAIQSPPFAVCSCSGLSGGCRQRTLTVFDVVQPSFVCVPCLLSSSIGHFNNSFDMPVGLNTFTYHASLRFVSSLQYRMLEPCDVFDGVQYMFIGFKP